MIFNTPSAFHGVFHYKPKFLIVSEELYRCIGSPKSMHSLILILENFHVSIGIKSPFGEIRDIFIY